MPGCGSEPCDADGLLTMRELKQQPDLSRAQPGLEQLSAHAQLLTLTLWGHQ